MKKFFALFIFMFLISCNYCSDSFPIEVSTPVYNAAIVKLLNENNNNLLSMKQTLDYIVNPTVIKMDEWCGGDCMVIKNYYNYLMTADCYKAWDLLSDSWKSSFWHDDMMAFGGFCTKVHEITEKFEILSLRLLQISMPHNYITVESNWNGDYHNCLFDMILSPLPRWEINMIQCDRER